MSSAVDAGHVLPQWTFEPEQVVWVPNPEEGFVHGKYVKTSVVTVAGQPANLVAVDVDGQEQQFPQEKVFPVNPESQKGAPDNTTLMYLHDPHLLDNVRNRFMDNNIYTYTAHILIVVNPYKYFPELYSQDTLAKYRGRPIGTLPPHVFAVADRAYRAMIADGRNQGIIVSGESGAGKTETSKHVMSYLATVGGMEGGMGPLERRILEANPILEAFGNAKTLRNNNSSRFGKFTKIDFGKDGKIVGATIDTYLLERSRLLFQAKGERNYHVFYQMLAGMLPEEKAALKIDKLDASDCHYLNQGRAEAIEGVDDGADFRRVVSAMEHIGISLDDRNIVWKLLAGVLHLGNISFEELDDESAQIVDLDVLEMAAEMLQVDVLRLRTGLLFRSISAGRSDESFEIPLTASQAVVSRDSLASVIYSRLFDHIVGIINKSLRLHEDSEEEGCFIGILDIYGFESFRRNSFEQLTINYANEKVHQYFIKNTFKEEQEIYKREAIPCPEIKYQDNQDALSLLEDGKRGVFAMINDEAKKPKASDGNLLMQMHTANRSKPRRWIKFSRAKPEVKNDQTDKEAFIFQHFAGPVCYSIEGFLDKNASQISLDAQLVLSTSENPLFPTLYPEFFKQKGTKSKKRHNSVSSQFLSQLNVLMDVLNSTNPSFIRCVKPNKQQVPGIYEGNLCLDQLRCSGMLEALALMQVGYPTRCPYDYLYNMYVNQMPEAIRHLPASQFCEAILMALELDKNEYALGVTRVFFKAGQLAFLEQLTGKDMSEGGIDIVAKVKRWLIRKRWFKAIAVTKTCVRLMKLNQGMQNFNRLRRAARVMHLINTTVLRKARAIKQRNATLTLQAVCKMFNARTQFKLTIDATLACQAHWRMLALRKPHLKEVQENRMRKKIEEDLRQKEEKEKARKEKREAMKSGAGTNPYAIGVRRTKKTPKKETAVETEAEKTELKEMKEQMKAMMEQMQPPGPPGEEGSEVPSGDGTMRPRVVSGASILASAEVEARLKAVEQYLKLIPAIDTNVLRILGTVTGTEVPTQSAPVVLQPPASPGGFPAPQTPTPSSSSPTTPGELATVVPTSDADVQTGGSAVVPPAGAVYSAPVPSDMAAQMEKMQLMVMNSMAMMESQGAVLNDIQARREGDEAVTTEKMYKLEGQKAELEEMLVKAKVEVEVKAAENTALEQQMIELKQFMVELKSDKAKVDDERSRLLLTTETLEADKEAMQSKLKSKEKENADLQEKVHDLADQLVNLKRSVKELIQIRNRNQKQQSKRTSSAKPTPMAAAGPSRSSSRPDIRGAAARPSMLSPTSKRISSASLIRPPPSPPKGPQS